MNIMYIVYSSCLGLRIHLKLNFMCEHLYEFYYLLHVRHLTLRVNRRRRFYGFCSCYQFCDKTNHSILGGYLTFSFDRK